MTIMPSVAWYGFHMWSRIDAGRVAFRRACPFAVIVSREATTGITISTCFCRKRVAHATVATHR